MYKLIEEIWKETVREYGYKFGEDYISMETKEYLVICPFSGMVMYNLDGNLRKVTCGEFHLSHCVCGMPDAFAMWYDILYNGDRLKTFFFRKDMSYSSNKTLDEFTCWVDRGDKLPHFTHDIRNHLVNGTYEKGYNESVYDPTCVEGREDDFKFVNNLTSLVFDRLFLLYDTYKQSLELTLYSWFDANYAKTMKYFEKNKRIRK